MKIMLIGRDNYLGTIMDKVNSGRTTITMYIQNDFEPLKVISSFLNIHPSILIIDDDYLSPNTLLILETICKLNKKTRIIFTTSSTSLELGKQVSQLGIYYYAIKPVYENEITDLLDSILDNNKGYSFN